MRTVDMSTEEMLDNDKISDEDLAALLAVYRHKFGVADTSMDAVGDDKPLSRRDMEYFLEKYRQFEEFKIWVDYCQTPWWKRIFIKYPF